jgi:hypothetical protein
MSDQIQVVEVRNFDMTFGRMVWFMVKWAFATIPALVILIVVGVLAFALVRGTVTGIAQGLQQARSVQSATDNYSASYSQRAPCVPPQLPSVEAEIANAQQLLAAGKFMEAYGVAHSAEMRSDLNRSQRRTFEGIRTKAWVEIQRSRP